MSEKMEATQQPKTPQAVDACKELIVWMVLKLDKFPRSRRYTLGQRLEALLLEVLERLVAAAYASQGDRLGSVISRSQTAS